MSEGSFPEIGKSESTPPSVAPAASAWGSGRKTFSQIVGESAKAPVKQRKVQQKVQEQQIQPQQPQQQAISQEQLQVDEGVSNVEPVSATGFEEVSPSELSTQVSEPKLELSSFELVQPETPQEQQLQGSQWEAVAPEDFNSLVNKQEPASIEQDIVESENQRDDAQEPVRWQEERHIEEQQTTIHSGGFEVITKSVAEEPKPVVQTPIGMPQVNVASQPFPPQQAAPPNITPPFQQFQSQVQQDIFPPHFAQHPILPPGASPPPPPIHSPPPPFQTSAPQIYPTIPYQQSLHANPFTSIMNRGGLQGQSTMAPMGHHRPPPPPTQQYPGQFNPYMFPPYGNMYQPYQPMQPILVTPLAPSHQRGQQQQQQQQQHSQGQPIQFQQPQQPQQHMPIPPQPGQVQGQNQQRPAPPQVQPMQQNPFQQFQQPQFPTQIQQTPVPMQPVVPQQQMGSVEVQRDVDPFKVMMKGQSQAGAGMGMQQKVEASGSSESWQQVSQDELIPPVPARTMEPPISIRDQSKSPAIISSGEDVQDVGQMGESMYQLPESIQQSVEEPIAQESEVEQEAQENLLIDENQVPLSTHLEEAAELQAESEHVLAPVQEAEPEPQPEPVPVKKPTSYIEALRAKQAQNAARGRGRGQGRGGRQAQDFQRKQMGPSTVHDLVNQNKEVIQDRVHEPVQRNLPISPETSALISWSVLSMEQREVVHRLCRCEAATAFKGPVYSEYLHQFERVGLENPSNNCFSNSVLQALLTHDEFCGYMRLCRDALPMLEKLGLRCMIALGKFALELEGKLPKRTKTASTATKQQSTGGPWMEIGPNKKPMYKSMLGRPAIPDMFEELLRSFRPQLAHNSQYSTQEDAVEFIQFLIDQLDVESTQLMKTVGVPLDMEEGEGLEEGGQETEGQGWLHVGRKSHYETRGMQYMRKSTMIIDLVGGLFRSILRAGLQKPMGDIQPFTVLPVPIDSEGISSVYDAILKWGEREEVHGYKDQNSNKVSAHKYMKIIQAPRLLILQLMRYEDGGNKKSHKKIQYRDNLRLDGRILDDASGKQYVFYKLIATINHLGMETKTGHYMADVLVEDPKHRDKTVWCRCNDQDVQSIQGQSAMTQKPYLLFYRLIDQ